MTNNMASLGLWEILYLPILYTLQMTPELCDVWKMGCQADKMAHGKAMLADEVAWNMLRM